MPVLVIFLLKAIVFVIVNFYNLGSPEWGKCELTERLSWEVDATGSGLISCVTVLKALDVGSTNALLKAQIESGCWQLNANQGAATICEVKGRCCCSRALLNPNPVIFTSNGVI